jgi:hypothetical protein
LDLVTIGDVTKELMRSYIKNTSRKQQSAAYSGPITIQDYQRFQFQRDQLQQEGFTITLPTDKEDF